MFGQKMRVEDHAKLSAQEAFKRKYQVYKVQDTWNSDGKKINPMDSPEGQFVKGGLEWIDPIVKKPLRRFHWYRDMPILPGGGALEYSSFFRAQYEVSSSNDNAASGMANQVAEVKASFEKQITIVKSYAWNISIGWIDQMKMAQVGSSIPQLQNEGVMLYYNQKLDNIAFFGMVDEGNEDAYGLLNNPNITANPVDKPWIDFADPSNEADEIEIFRDINISILSIVEETAYDPEKAPNHALLPDKVYTKLSQPMVIGSANTGVLTSIIEYTKQNMAMKHMYDTSSDEVDFLFFMNKYLSKPEYGVGNNGRAVFYRYDREAVRMPLPMDLTRGATMYNPQSFEVMTSFVAFIGQPQFIFPETILYRDNIMNLD